MFTFREKRSQVPPVPENYSVNPPSPHPRTAAPPPFLPLYIKDSLKEDRVGWLLAKLATADDAAGGWLLCVCKSKDQDFRSYARH
jgi:hypothetical protein